MKNFTEITVITTHVGAELVSSVMWDYTDGGVFISDVEDVLDLIKAGKSWDYADDDVMNRDKSVLVKAYVPFEDKKTVAEIEKSLRELKKRSEFDLGTLETIKRTVDGDAWKKQWEEHFRPIHIGKVTVVPEWIKYEPKKDEIPVYIGSNMAFGTGEHETTSMCVEYLTKYVTDNDVVADVGSGSGILGITAAKLGAKSVIMTDIDECAVKASNDNVKLNNVKNATVILKNLLDDQSIVADVIVANIMAELLIAFAPHIGKNVKSGGTVILSGILADRLNKVIKAYENAGFTYAESKINGEWSALVVKKP
ncbi:MAG: 50S ribosomal protein L11 methyltransferase [Clostridia bacterium]|nr:50S ribosomal protein L11 methyltransferase [Clostridia bacterium]